MEAILLMGVQASGKSTFYRRRFFQTHLHISLDLLRTRYRERALLALCLETQIPFAVDNTNPTAEDRARYLSPAKERGYRLVGYYFSSSVRSALERNRKREGRARVPDKAVLGTYARMEMPSYGEGFDVLYFVRFQAADERAGEKQDERSPFEVLEWNDDE